MCSAVQCSQHRRYCVYVLVTRRHFQKATRKWWAIRRSIRRLLCSMLYGLDGKRGKTVFGNEHPLHTA